ncbi:hypothetical protein KIN20_004913 [Parelaphostrongylus tenuis]|uniref:Uncharacterized protein n=1 Tax=Parelaphostrongylus tenuis TaxID=148309 RepID=A0AAD5M2D7_PARTN|nr:hypothetical protein KIN20_004913 [Parelaphostrongylus tenuis]
MGAGGLPGMGMGMGLDMLNSPYGYSSYYLRCRNPYGLGGMHNPMVGHMMGKRKK